MPFTVLEQTKLSDLVQNELDPSVGYARQALNVTPDGVVKMGTVVFRAKANTNTAGTAYAALSASTDVVAANEFAVVYGDHYSAQSEFTPRAIAAGKFNAVGFVGKNGALILKEQLIKKVAQDAAGANLTDEQFEVLREALKAQGIILEQTI